MSRQRVLVVAGPTAVGKTAVALEIAELIGAEIVSADSVQVYRGMDIGSAKPTAEERRRVPHHLIDVAAPDEPFSAGRYAKLAGAAVGEIAARGRPVLVVGGSGLYIRALLGGLAPGVEAAPEVRRRIAERLARTGLAGVRRSLREVDPEAADRIHVNDAYRLTRALEVYELTGKPLSAIHAEHGWRTDRYDAHWIGLTEERARLYARIEARCDRMVSAGLLAEVAALERAGYTQALRPMRSLGYRQMSGVLAGSLTMAEALAQVKKETRRYARRQLTWFRARKEIEWFAPSARKAEVLERARQWAG
ncbi:MAG: tRNA (adenosine(37)-N6)-dimethylallyltransferase MiaA [Myxococcota bacterium]